MTASKQPLEKIALYRKVVQDIQNQIESGQLRGGEKLPPIRALCESYGVSNITISAALRELVSSGSAQSKPRLGVFVADRRENGGEAQLKGERVVAFMVPMGKTPFFMELIHGAEEECRKRGYRLLIVNTQNDVRREAEQLQMLSREVAGLLATPIDDAQNHASYLALLRTRTPLVFVDHYIEGLAAPSVASDNEEGGYLATKHLLDTRRRLIYVVADGEGTSTGERLQGYRRALEEAGIAFDPSLIVQTQDRRSRAADYRGFQLLLKERENSVPCGVFAMNEYIARGVYGALREIALRVPEDVAVVGFDDAFAPFLDPPLSTVRQDLHGVGRCAAGLLFDSLKSGKKTPQSIRLKPQLVVRHSSDAHSVFCPRQHYDATRQPSTNHAVASR